MRDAVMNDRFRATLGTEDQPRPRMELGLRVWSTTAPAIFRWHGFEKKSGGFIDRLGFAHSKTRGYTLGLESSLS